jgi:hypothetical protein
MRDQLHIVDQRGNLSDVQEVIMVETVGALRAVLSVIAALKLYRVADDANILCRTTPDGSGHATDADGLFRLVMVVVIVVTPLVWAAPLMP